MTPSITDTQVGKAIGGLLTAILPSTVTVIVGQVNRTASPEGDYCVMWPLRRPRFATNLETAIDTRYLASIEVDSIAGPLMLVTAIATGTIEPGNSVFGVNVADLTVVLAQISGNPGGTGTYQVSIAQTVSSETMSSGTLEIETSTEAVWQIDVHGPNSADNAQVISTIMRSGFAVDQMAATGVTPLFAEDPRQAPFITAADQYESRWMVDVHFQIKPSVMVGQEFFNSATITLIEINSNVPAPPSENSLDFSIPDNSQFLPGGL